MESEGVYKGGPGGTVASEGDVESAFYIRLREINDTIRSGSEGWEILRPVSVVHKGKAFISITKAGFVHIRCNDFVYSLSSSVCYGQTIAYRY